MYVYIRTSIHMQWVKYIYFSAWGLWHVNLLDVVVLHIVENIKTSFLFKVPQQILTLNHSYYLLISVDSHSHACLPSHDACYKSTFEILVIPDRKCLLTVYEHRDAITWERNTNRKPLCALVRRYIEGHMHQTVECIVFRTPFVL